MSNIGSSNTILGQLLTGQSIKTEPDSPDTIMGQSKTDLSNQSDTGQSIIKNDPDSGESNTITGQSSAGQSIMKTDTDFTQSRTGQSKTGHPSTGRSVTLCKNKEKVTDESITKTDPDLSSESVSQSVIIADKEEMESNPFTICRICLATNVPICSLNVALQEVYEKLTKISFNQENKPMTVCHICNRLMSKSHDLMTRALTADSLLTKILNDGMINEKSMSAIDRRANKLAYDLTVTPTNQSKDLHYQSIQRMLHVDIKIESQDDNYDVKVKQEPLSENEMEYEVPIENVVQTSNYGLKTPGASKQAQPMTIPNPRPVKSRGGKQDDTDKHHQCNICSKWFSHSSNLKRHLIRHTGVKPFECHVCKYRFCEKSTLKAHLRTHTQERPFECTTCHHKFNHNSALKAHMKVHTGERPFQCKICFHTFILESNLKLHFKKHTNDRKFECQECHKKFVTNSTLKDHMKIHTGIRPFQCQICPTSFYHKGHLNTHMKIHTNDRPYQCQVCEKKFYTNSLLKVHFRVHSGEKPYECNDCGHKFNHRTHLIKHLRIHENLRLFECGVCDRKFTQRSGLTVHMKTHKLTIKLNPQI